MWPWSRAVARGGTYDPAPPGLAGSGRPPAGVLLGLAAADMAAPLSEAGRADAVAAGAGRAGGAAAEPGGNGGGRRRSQRADAGQCRGRAEADDRGDPEADGPRRPPRRRLVRP